MIYLASIPRCGSTYLLRSICGLPQGSTTPAHVTDDYGITKLHRPPEDAGVEYTLGDSAVFLFGDIPEAVVSTKSYRWDANHFRNCGATFDPNAPIFDEDVLGYAETFHGWRRADFPVLFVRYRALETPRVRTLIEAWLGRSIEWLPWRDRRTKVSSGVAARLLPAYGDLINTVEALPEVFVAGNLAGP